MQKSEHVEKPTDDESAGKKEERQKENTKCE